MHLIVRDTGRGEIPASMQLVEGCTAQSYNRRKRRGGALWEDQYHATAIETGEPLARCLVYVDLNMVRTGVVDHPREWEVGGYHEIQQSPTRFRIVDRAALAEVLCVDLEELAAVHGEWIEHALRQRPLQRDERWSESIAAGSRAFVEGVRADLGSRGRHRSIDDVDDLSLLRAPCGPYTPIFATEIAPPS